jgi:two-component system, response regulator PdtaR
MEYMAQKIIILVVEDETLIRMGAVQMLEDVGFAVVEAGNADEAVRILEDRKDICAIFTDINMPGTMDGMKLARMVRDRWPPIHVIVTSGLISPNDDDLPPGGKFIRKPYDSGNVIATIRELLRQTSPSDPLLQARKAA